MRTVARVCAGVRTEARLALLAVALVAAPLLTGCQKQAAPAAYVRPVRSVVVAAREIGDPVVLTGQLRARDEVGLAFRLAGKLIERSVGVGDTVTSGRLVARLDDEMERNTRTAARADLAAAQAFLDQSRAYEKRVGGLLSGRAVSRTEYEGALRQLKTAEAQVAAAQARLDSAGEQLQYTELRAEADGVITEKGAEPGEVVRAGQPILTLARQSGRDAVFGVPARVVREGLTVGQEVDVWLADNAEIRAAGRIREIAPQADPATRNYQVKAALADPPAGMFLGATVVGRLQLQADALIEIPASALVASDGQPAVWVVDEQAGAVHARPIGVARYTPDSVIVSEGLRPGERVVTAGVHELHEGQAITLLGDPL